MIGATKYSPSEPCLWCASESEAEKGNNSMNEKRHKQQKPIQRIQYFSRVNKHISQEQTMINH